MKKNRSKYTESLNLAQLKSQTHYNFNIFNQSNVIKKLT